MTRIADWLATILFLLLLAQLSACADSKPHTVGEFCEDSSLVICARAQTCSIPTAPDCYGTAVAACCQGSECAAPAVPGSEACVTALRSIACADLAAGRTPPECN